MSKRWSISAGAIAVLLVSTMTTVSLAQTRLPRIFADHMVLQRGRKLPVWGWSGAGDRVSVRLSGKDTDVTVETTAGGDGRWRTELPAQKAGGPLVMTVRGGSTVSFKDVLVGEVWLCSGQSNMEVPVAPQPGVSWWKGVLDYKKELAGAAVPGLRLFHVKTTWQRAPIQDVNGTWAPSNAKSAAGFSGTAFFFGRKLRKELDVPVGLIAAAVGGMPIEQFSPHSGQAFWYNGMIAPVIPYGIRGAIWYQGETNLWAGDRANYFGKQKALIDSWRQIWGQGDFPFYLAQLAPLDYGDDLYSLPRFWEAQARTLTVANTGIVSTTDIGDVKDVHPRNKRGVGERLALWALAKDYGKDVVCSGPTFRSTEVEGDRVRVLFDNVGSGLKSRNRKPLDSFEIAGDGDFVEAKAVIDGDSVLVSSKSVSSPTLVRFGWRCTANPNLQNKEGLPAYPFRTGSGAPSISGKRLFAEKSVIELVPGEPDGSIHYTLDGSAPGKDSPLYGAAIHVDRTTTIRARFFRNDGVPSNVVSATFTRAEPRKYRRKTLHLGVSYKYYEGSWDKIPRLSRLEPVKTGTASDFGIQMRNRNDGFALMFSGYLDVEEAGTYTFQTTSDDGSRLFVDGKLVVDNDGIHAPVTKSGQVRLRAGMRKINVVYFEGGGGEALSVKYKGPSVPLQQLPCWCER